MVRVGAGREVCVWVLLMSGSPQKAQSSAHRALVNGSGN